LAYHCSTQILVILELSLNRETLSLLQFILSSFIFTCCRANSRMNRKTIRIKILNWCLWHCRLSYHKRRTFTGLMILSGVLSSNSCNASVLTNQELALQALWLNVLLSLKGSRSWKARMRPCKNFAQGVFWKRKLFLFCSLFEVPPMQKSTSYYTS